MSTPTVKGPTLIIPINSNKGPYFNSDPLSRINPMHSQGDSFSHPLPRLSEYSEMNDRSELRRQVSILTNKNAALATENLALRDALGVDGDRSALMGKVIRLTHDNEKLRQFVGGKIVDQMDTAITHLKVKAFPKS